MGPLTHASSHSEPTKSAQGRMCLKVPGQSQAGSIFRKVDLFEDWHAVHFITHQAQ